ncbi:hypothetical protein Tco_0723845 [Tanacetum coccineum]
MNKGSLSSKIGQQQTKDDTISKNPNKEVARILALPTPPPSPLTPLSSPLPQIPSPPLPLPSPPTHTSPTYAKAPLGYKAAGIWFEVGESSAAGAARQPRSTVARKVDYSFVDTVDASIQDTKRRTMDAIEVVNLRYERVEARQALDRSEAHNKALEARIIVLETWAYRHEWQRQDANDHATKSIMCI